MKKIGLLGGMSWESTANYYRLINEGVKQALGGLHSAKINLVSVDFAEIEHCQMEGRWQDAGELLANEAKSIETSGAEGLLICTNTMHKVAEQIEDSINIPLLHIADATAEVLIKDQRKTVGLLGTQFTMDEHFYKGRLTEKFGIDVMTPDPVQSADIHRIIYNELCLGEINDTSRSRYIEIMKMLTERGAEAIILGCTEIAMLVKPIHTDIPLYDTTEIHAAKAVEWALTE